MHMDHVESSPRTSAEKGMWPVKGMEPRNGKERVAHSEKAELDLILNHMEKKYGVLVSEIRDKEEISYLISPPARSRRAEARSFVVGKYSNEHMMRNFSRYLNKGRLNRQNVDETIGEMKSLQAFCR